MSALGSGRDPLRRLGDGHHHRQGRKGRNRHAHRKKHQHAAHGAAARGQAPRAVGKSRDQAALPLQELQKQDQGNFKIFLTLVNLGTTFDI